MGGAPPPPPPPPPPPMPLSGAGAVRALDCEGRGVRRTPPMPLSGALGERLEALYRMRPIGWRAAAWDACDHMPVLGPFALLQTVPGGGVAEWPALHTAAAAACMQAARPAGPLFLSHFAAAR